MAYGKPSRKATDYVEADGEGYGDAGLQKQVLDGILEIVVPEADPIQRREYYCGERRTAKNSLHQLHLLRNVRTEETSWAEHQDRDQDQEGESIPKTRELGAADKCFRQAHQQS